MADEMRKTLRETLGWMDACVAGDDGDEVSDDEGDTESDEG